MNCITKIKEMRKSFTKTELKISEHILEFPNETKNLSAKELADNIGISQPSIIRFSKKLGFAGYTEFKLALAEALASIKNKGGKKHILYDKISLEDSANDIVDKLVYQNSSAMKNTISLMDFNLLNKAVNLINKSKKIYILGVGFSGLVAKNFMYKLSEIGVNAIYIDDSHIQLTAMNNATPKDLIFAISHSGQTYEILKAVEVAKESKAKIITLTKVFENDLSKMADIALTTIAENTSYRLTAISSTMTQLSVIDSLYLLFIKKNYKKSFELTKKNTETVKVLKYT